jgi:hypothetical protein
VPVASQRSFVGIAKEAVRATGVPATAELPVKTIAPEDVVKYLPVEVFKGSFPKVYGEVQGLKNTTFEIAGPVFADTYGWPLACCLGDITTTAQRSVSDGVTTSGSPNVSSATGAFTAADLGKNIGHANIPAGAVIQTVTSGTAVVMSQNSTATGAALTLLIGPPQWHVINLLNSGTGQPTSQTLTDFYGLTSGSPARMYAGMQCHETMIKFSAEGLLEHSSKYTGLVPSALVSLPVASFTGVQPTPAWTGLVTIGGTIVSTAADGDVTITRTVELIPAMTGTQQYLQVWIGDAVVKGKLVAVVDPPTSGDTELIRMLTNTQPSLDLNFSQGSGATAQQLALHMTSAAYLKAKSNRGKQWVAYDIEFEAVANTTDVGASGGFGLCTAKLGNNIAAGTWI